MKGFEVSVDDTIKKGLRRFKEIRRNSLGLVECVNMAPREAGLETHEVLTHLDADGISWGGGAAYGVDDTDSGDTIVDG